MTAYHSISLIFHCYLLIRLIKNSPNKNARPQSKIRLPFLALLALSISAACFLSRSSSCLFKSYNFYWTVFSLSSKSFLRLFWASSSFLILSFNSLSLFSSAVLVFWNSYFCVESCAVCFSRSIILDTIMTYLWSEFTSSLTTHCYFFQAALL